MRTYEKVVREEGNMETNMGTDDAIGLQNNIILFYSQRKQMKVEK